MAVPGLWKHPLELSYFDNTCVAVGQPGLAGSLTFIPVFQHPGPSGSITSLLDLFEKGLPVPRPVAALCQHKGLVATGAIMTECIPSATTLADVVTGAA